jgi:hypothetical protein
LGPLSGRSQGPRVPTTHDWAGVKAGLSDKRVLGWHTLVSVCLNLPSTLNPGGSAGEVR